MAEITVHSWLSMIWHDTRLKWDPIKFKGLNQIVVHEHDIWIPKLALFNSPSSQFEENCAETPCHVSFTGEVSCIPSCTHNAFCKTNFKNWPFDIQNCTFHMGSWMNHGGEVKFLERQTAIDKSAIKHNNFNIIKLSVRNNIGKYKGVNNTYPSIHYNIILERHAVFELTCIFSPAVIFAVIHLSMLWLAPDCGERIFMIVLSILIHFIILQELAYIIPKNGDTVPVVLIYFRDSMIIAAFLLVQTIICRGLLLRRQNSPQWVKTLTDSLRGHKVGQFMFENPYLINRGTNMNSTNENTINDSVNLVDNEAGNKADKPSTSADTENIWIYAVKVFDTLLFFILLISYIVMMIGWFPDVKSSYLDEKTVDVTS